jgi:hypothetical protein
MSACGGVDNLPAAKPFQSRLDPLALQQMQTQEFETSKQILFASTVSVFQDTGFIIEAGDLASGIITGKSPTTRAEPGNYYWMKLSTGETFEERATAFVEESRLGHAKLRLNFIARRTLPALGVVSVSETPNEDPAYYETVFNKIREAVFLREAYQSAPAEGA